MEKPDFETMARGGWDLIADQYNGWRNLSVDEKRTLIAITQAAYDAGLERAAEISKSRFSQFTSCHERDEWQYAADEITDAIRAEKSQ